MFTKIKIVTLFVNIFFITSCYNSVQWSSISKENSSEQKTTEQQANFNSTGLSTETTETPGDLCSINPYKKKIAVTTFYLVYPGQAVDIPRIPYEFAEILARKLHASQNFIVRDVEEVKIFDNYPIDQYSTEQKTGEFQDNTALIYLAEKLDAQFIISGIIQDFNFHKFSFANPLDFLNTIDERVLRVEIFIYDGLTGAMIERRMYEKIAKGNVYFSNITHMDSEEFLKSDIGQAVEQVIREQVRDIGSRLKCFPLMEKVLKVERENIYFNAGSLQNIHIGDTFPIYSAADKYAAGVYYQGSRLRGYLEKPKSILTVIQVQPLFSIGILDFNEKKKIYPFDVIKSY
ncbi:hypothetical protein CCP3SC5AM1_1360006 [Gammaproteobacteria bacterium]